MGYPASSLYLIFIVNPSVCSKIKNFPLLIKSLERWHEPTLNFFIDAIKMWELTKKKKEAIHNISDKNSF